MPSLIGRTPLLNAASRHLSFPHPSHLPNHGRVAIRFAHSDSRTPSFTIPVRRTGASAFPSPSDPDSLPHQSSATQSSTSSSSSSSPAPTSPYLSRKLSNPFGSASGSGGSAGLGSRSRPQASDFDPAAPEPTNPIDYVTQERYDRARTAYLNRRGGLYAIGSAVCMAAILGTVLFIGDPENLDKTKSQASGTGSGGGSGSGSGVHRCDGPTELERKTGSGTDIVTRDGVRLVATQSSHVPYFPSEITMPEAIAAATEGAVTLTGPSSRGGAGTSSEDDKFVLVGLGVRKVSFLNIQVYVVGMYVRASQLDLLRTRLRERAARLASSPPPPSSSSSPPPHLSPSGADDAAGLETVLAHPTHSYDIWNDMLRFDPGSASSLADIDTFFRIVPTRATDFNHLRDGWVNGIRAVTTDFRQRRKDHHHQTERSPGAGADGAGASSPASASSPSSASPTTTTAFAATLPVPPSIVADLEDLETDSFVSSMRAFQSIFNGRGKVPFGNGLILFRHGRDGALSVFYEDQHPSSSGVGTEVKKPKNKAGAGAGAGQYDTLVTGSTATVKTLMGRVGDERVARMIWLRYLAGKNVSSEEARKSIAGGVLRGDRE